MKTKFLKYWRDIPLLYSFTFILDPRAKLKVRLQRAPQLSRAGKKRTNWGMIYGDDNDSIGTGLGAGSSTPTPNLSRMTSASALLHAATTNASFDIVSELSTYLESDNLQKFDDDDFNILNWWHEHQITYPVLSILAKDVLTVPVSTISSESTFSLTGKIIEERRRRLNPKMVEMLTCIKDWEEGEARAQHTAEDKELEDSSSNLFLDDVAQEAQPPSDPSPSAA
ncbi:hypothetical protein U9M48_042039 [Paspalum notatum var. saurae]|uniref:HAT C-terminal dimerisation domain-containing protein n=1 Tax=Paspalum notatum var. saurae TaxID=547442 RepID=A0AAQ3UW31_PASNO